MVNRAVKVIPLQAVAVTDNGLGAFAHHLLVHLAFGRYVDDDVALDRGLATQAAALFQATPVLYWENFAAVLEALGGCLEVEMPEAGFYLWPVTPVDDSRFARGLLEQQNVTVLPGSFLSRTHAGVNPGKNHVRMALVAPLDDCIEAAERIRAYLAAL